MHSRTGPSTLFAEAVEKIGLQITSDQLPETILNESNSVASC